MGRISTKGTRFLKESRGQRRRVLSLSGTYNESGYALATLMLIAAFLLIAITAGLPDIKTQAKREKELELQFRAMQYVRAIQAYNRKFPNQWPTSIDALMNTNNVRFLRKKWKDPMTKDGGWRFIHLGPNGVVIDSQTTFKGANAPSATGTSTPAGMQTPAGTITPFGNQPTGQNPSSMTGFSLGSGSSTGGLSSLSATQLSNLPIVGVASLSTDQSLMSCNGYDHYNEWEYIALPQGRYAGTGCYEGIPITMLLPPGSAPGQAVPGFGTTQPTTPTQGPATAPTSQTPFGGLQPQTTNPPTSMFGTPRSQKRDRQ